MNRFRITLLILPVLGLSLLAVAFARHSKDNSPSRQGLAIEIALSKSFVIPAGTAEQRRAAFIRVPANPNNNAHAAQISAIKVLPETVGDKVKITVSTLVGDTRGIKQCSDWNNLKESPVATYTISKGEEITVPQLANLGANFKDGKLTIRAVPAPDGLAPYNSGGGGCGCGWCGRLSCCPSEGYCISCAPCGDVCCAPPGGN
ncbi:MAG TPA: hypothetical protein VGB17_08670 [Pyrinomonadaceae bacterium]|jgi:hypothetical protein